MYLKSIKANGFKSFADKTDILLDDNITCVVGPNGSGKSNIVDAIRWVLGEQSIKNLRGSNGMSDIIFSGSKSRNAANRAEVSLTFDNKDHYLKSELEEIEVKRVLYRSGESEYFINGAKVRLQDITDLFLDTGSGIDSFNIISQGSIESVVNSKPLERRVIFEEAAGVLKYKKRKEKSLKKLEKTKENIEKVDLIIKELQVNLDPLREQSENAQKYLNLKEELKNIEIATITEEITNLNTEYQKIKEEIATINEELLEENTLSSQEASHLETLKLKNIRLEEEISKTNQSLLEITSQFVNLQNEKVMYTERKKFSGNMSDVEQNLIHLKEEILELNKAIHRLEEDCQKETTLLESSKRQLEENNEKESLLKVKRNSLQQKMQEYTYQLYSLESKRDVLETSLLNDSKMPNAVRNVLNNVRLKGVYNTIGKLIEIPKLYGTAIEVALGASAQFVVVENERVAKECITFLKENKLGRATFFPLNIIKEKTIFESVLKDIKGLEGFIGVAADLISFDSKFAPIIKNQLGNVLVVKDIDTLNILGKKLEYKYRIVSLDGEIMHTGGSLTGGTFKNDTSFLKDKMELENIKKEIDKTITSKKNAEVELKKMEEELNQLKTTEEQLNRERIVQQESLNEKRVNLEAKQSKEMELQKELDGSKTLKNGELDKKLLSLMEETTKVENEKNGLVNHLEELKNDKENLGIEIDTLEKEYREKNSHYNKLQTELKNKEVAIGKMDIRLDTLLLNLSESYNLTYEQAKLSYVLELDATIAKNKVASLKEEIARLGEVNVFSIEEYERVHTRYDFLTHQKEDLESASENLLNIINEMDTIMVERFSKTFALINEEFKKVFKKLFKGGEGLLKLTEPENILETGIEIIAEPPGKKLNSIGLLSGGEKTLTAISLLFAVLNVKTVPFCVLDEVEAALDEANVDAFGKYLQEYKDNSQFILITYKKRTMEYADNLYGITMQESGVSKIVSVKLENVS